MLEPITGLVPTVYCESEASLYPVSNMQKGFDGEQPVSSITFELGIPHEHNDFTSLEAYQADIGGGPDIRSDEEKFHMEVKHFFTSWLDTKENHERLVQPRFRDTPVDYIKFTTIIGGVVTARYVIIANRDNVIIIHVPNMKYLKSMLAYYYHKYGIGPQYKRPTMANGGYIELPLPEPLSSPSSVLSYVLVVGKGEPPPDVV